MGNQATHCSCGTTYNQTQTVDECPNCGARSVRYACSYEFTDDELLHHTRHDGKYVHTDTLEE